MGIVRGTYVLIMGLCTADDIDLEETDIHLPELACTLLPFIDGAHTFLSRTEVDAFCAHILPLLHWTGNDKVTCST